MLRSEPCIFMEDNLVNHQTLENYDRVAVDHKEFSDDGVALEINYDLGT